MSFVNSYSYIQYSKHKTEPYRGFNLDQISFEKMYFSENIYVAFLAREEK